MEAGRGPNRNLPGKIVIWLSVSFGIVVFVGVVVAFNYKKTHWTKQQAIEWYARYNSWVSGGVHYEGSDQKRHYFTARVMDDTAFLAIKKAELKLDDERPYIGDSRTKNFYYVVDPSRNFQKFEDGGQNKKEP